MTKKSPYLTGVSEEENNDFNKRHQLTPQQEDFILEQGMEEMKEKEK